MHAAPINKTLPIIGQNTVTPPVSGEAVLPISNEAIAQPNDQVLAEHLRAYEEVERERLGLKNKRRQWVDNMLNPHVSLSEGDQITILLSGLTKAQDFLVEGALRGVGYKVKDIGCPDNEGLQLGKEYGNRGQCNPTYFTVGNLIKYLIELRDENGMTSEDVVKNYVFLSAGACGPCRFGMYVTEYRKALRDAGFDGFRVMLFQQQGGLDQATGEETGLKMNPEFFIGIIKAIVCGDVINALGYRIRPYEIEEGATNRVMESAKRQLYEALLQKKNIVVGLFKCRKHFEAIAVDKLRAKPKVCIIGEFWAMTTEGAGNYQLQRFLETEGSECDIQLTTAWILYSIWEIARDTRERDDLRVADGGVAGLREHQGVFDVATRQATLRAAEWALRAGFQMFAKPTGLFSYKMPNMNEIAEVANEYYSNDLRGGEGHMEVGKLIVNVVNNKCHMTLSVKPFGCMPSSGVSDGVQSLITSKYPSAIYCAVETSGDGATNFYSRVQMYLHKARIAAEKELETALSETKLSREQINAFLKKHPRYASPLHHSPHAAAGSAANLVYEVAPLIHQTAYERAANKARAYGAGIARGVSGIPRTSKKAFAKLRDPAFQQALKVDQQLLIDVLHGKALAHYRPLMQQLIARGTGGSGHADEPQNEPLAAE